jgi:hypothetical protein
MFVGYHRNSAAHTTYPVGLPGVAARPAASKSLRRSPIARPVLSLCGEIAGRKALHARKTLKQGAVRLNISVDRGHGGARARRDDRPNGHGRSRPPEVEHSNQAVHRPPGEALPNQTG